MAQDTMKTPDHLKSGARLAWRRLTLPFRVLIRLSKTTLAILMMCFVLLSIALPIVTVMSATVFAVVSTIAEAAISAPSVLSRQTKVLVDKEAALVAERAAAKEAKEVARKAEARTATALQRTTQARLAEQALKKQVTALETELITKVEARVTYRNEKRLLSEAVEDTTRRVAVRIRTMVGTDISSMAGQAIPVIGVAAIVASIGYDVYQSCEMVKELHKLDLAFNPEHAIVDAAEVCGTRVPPVSEVWELAQDAPDAALAAAMDAFPDFQWDNGWTDLLGYVPSPTELATIASDAIHATESWFSTFLTDRWNSLTDTFGFGTGP